jgi:glycosyltransferase involved in cell wall biosynthesis
MSDYVDTPIPGLGQAPGPRAVLAARALRGWVRDERLDVVLTNTATASTVVRSVGVSCPVVYFCHGLHWAGPGGSASDRFARFVEAALVPATDGVITMNHADRAWFDIRSSSLRRMHLYAGIGLDLDAWPWIDRSVDAGDVRLAWVGDFSARKRPGDAVVLVRTLRDRGIRASLTMVGDGPLLEATRASCEPSLPISFVGRAPSAPFLADADALVHTAAWEGLSRVLLESSAMGIASFGYAVKGVQECPGTRSAGDAGDVSALAESVIEWIEAGLAPPQLDRALLDWRLAHDQVTMFLGECLGQSADSPH